LKLTLLGKAATKEAAEHQEHNGGKRGLCVIRILVLSLNTAEELSTNDELCL